MEMFRSQIAAQVCPECDAKDRRMLIRMYSSEMGLLFGLHQPFISCEVFRLDLHVLCAQGSVLMPCAVLDAQAFSCSVLLVLILLIHCVFAYNRWRSTIAASFVLQCKFLNELGLTS